MITLELTSYIKKQINNKISRDLIKYKLNSVGWHVDDIEEGFFVVEQEYKKEVKLPKLEELSINNSEFIKETSGLEIFSKELPVGDVVNNVKITPKVWVPMRAPVKEYKQIQPEFLELNSENEPVIKTAEEVNKTKETGVLDKEPELIDLKYFKKEEELIPTLIPKSINNSVPLIIGTEELVKKNINNNNIKTEEPLKNSFMSNLPQSAMLSSYESDLLSVNKNKEEVIKKKVSFNFTKLIVPGIIVVLAALITWLFMSGIINIKNFKIPFVKEDPKVLLLNNSTILSSLESYKTETNIEISSPSFANISAGLTSGEAVTSEEKDSILIKTIGIINQTEGNLLSDNFVTIEGSIFEDLIEVDVKNNGVDLFVALPDLSKITKNGAPSPNVVKINKDQFSLLLPLFSKDIENKLNKIDFYKILSSGMSSFINSDTLGVYDEFIKNVEIIEKGQDKIKGIDTYHYLITPDRQLSKDLLNKISDNFVLNLSNEDEVRLSEILGSVSIRSFEVWVGKGDNNIYQYNVELDVPLSQIVGFQDKSIGDNLINIKWKTTYYDFNILNKVIMPETSIPMIDLVSEVKEIKIKNDTDSFRQFATSLNSTEGVFGSKSNTSGDCMSPTSGSLFSPIGHTKISITPVSYISELLNKIMGVTNGAGFCYSTPKAWSFTVPISDNYDPSSSTFGQYKYFYCLDNTGAKLELINPPTGVVCK
jgi:hypothetical protein